MINSTAKPHAVLFLGLSACAAGLLFSQQTQTPAPDEVRVRGSVYWPRPQFTLRVDTKLVEVGVVVRDSKGHTVSGLNRDDFEIEDGGKKREVKTFSMEASSRAVATPPEQPAAAAASPGQPAPTMNAPPRFVALLFDDLSIGSSELARVKTAAKRFLNEGLSAGDRMGIFTTSGENILSFTGDVPKIIETIDRFNSSARMPDGGICPHLTPYDAYIIANKLDQTALEIKAAEMSRCDPGRPANTKNPTANPGTGYMGTVQIQAENMWGQIHNISRASLRTMSDLAAYVSGMPGRRMILLASSGFLAQTLEQEQEEIIRYALRRQVVVNALDAKGLYTQDPIESTLGTDMQSFIRMNSLGTRQKDMSNEVMANFAASTGGLFFHNNNDLTLGFREVGLLPEVSYLLGFDPSEPLDGRYHKLKVQLKSKNRYSLQARLGYWAFPNSEQNPLNAERPIDQEILAVDTLEDLPARVMDVRATTEYGGPALDIVFHIDVGRLHLEKTGEVRARKLTWIVALLDTRGNFIVGKENGIELALKEPTFNRMAVNGLNVTLTLKAPPGPYTLRSVVQDGLDGKMAASSLRVEIR